MRPTNLIIAVGVALFTHLTAAAATAPNQLSVPDYSFQQQISVRMEATLAELRKENSLPHLEGWTPLTEMPAWVSEPAEREIAYVFPHPLISDGYRYAIVLGQGPDLIVVRTGGIAGKSEIFQGSSAAAASLAVTSPPFALRNAPARASLGVSALQ
ncbi:MAG: hypothetical protein ABIZ04_13450 [Opitutus sp.]